MRNREIVVTFREDASETNQLTIEEILQSFPLSILDRMAGTILFLLADESTDIQEAISSLNKQYASILTAEENLPYQLA